MIGGALPVERLVSALAFLRRLSLLERIDDVEALGKLSVIDRKLAGALGEVDDLFDEFGVDLGRAPKLDAPSSLAGDGRSYITYVFKEGDDVVYVGRASGRGDPSTVLRDRLAKGHDHFTDGLSASVVDVQGTKLASQGAEEIFIQGFIQRGAKLTNIDPAVSLKPSRLARTMEKLDAFFADLFRRQAGG